MDTKNATPASAASPGGRTFTTTIGQLTRRPEAGSLLGLIVVFVFFAVMGGKMFLSAAGYASWLNIASEIGIVALPVGLLMITGELDLSVGAVIPASSLTAAIISGGLKYDAPDIIGILSGLGVGLLIGFVNGYLVNRTAVPSLIVTIGTLFGTKGLTLGLTVMLAGSTSVPLVPHATAKLLLGHSLGGMFQVTMFWWLLFIVAAFFLLHISPVGNWIFALGGDKISAHNAGIPTQRLRIALYMFSGFCAAFVGVSQICVYESAQVLAGQSFIFNSIMCVVIGGVLLTGGSGSVIGIVLGTMTFSIVTQGIFFTNMDANLGSVIIGALLLIAVMTNDKFRQMALSYLPKKKK